MRIEYEDYTGEPEFNDFVTMVWQEMTKGSNWLWWYLSYDADGWSPDGKKYIGRLPLLKEQPKDFDPHTAKSFIDVYENLREYKKSLQNKEKIHFRRFYKKYSDVYKQGEIIKMYIKKISPINYTPNSAQYKQMANSLRQRLKNGIN